MEENKQAKWPAAVKQQIEAEVRAKTAAKTDSTYQGQFSLTCCSCRTIIISFLFYYLTLNAIIMVLTIVYREKGEDSPSIWWVGFLVFVITNAGLSIIALLVLIFSDASTLRPDPEQGAKKAGGQDDESASYKTILTINSKTLRSTPGEDNGPGVNQIAAAAALAAARGQEGRSPVAFPRLSTDSANQAFSNLTPDGSAPPSVILMDMKKNKRQTGPPGKTSKIAKTFKSEPKRAMNLEKVANPPANAAAPGKEVKPKKKGVKQATKKKKPLF